MKYLLLLGLSLSFPSVSALAESNSLSYADLKFDSEGHVINIDRNGVELYLYYTGAPRDTGENIRITVDDPSLKITYGKRCNIKPSPDTCKFVLAYANMQLPSYGKKSVTVLNESQEKIAEYVIWVKPSKDEREIHWKARRDKGSTYENTINGPVIMQNGTPTTRTYRINLAQRDEVENYFYNTRRFTLPARSLCFVDKDLYDSRYQESYKINFTYARPGATFFFPDKDGDRLVDVSNPNDTSYNGYFNENKNLISICSARGTDKCANKWRSWTVALMNLSGKVLLPDKGDDGIYKLQPGEIDYLIDNSWQSQANIYWTKNWSEERVALFTIQGTTDGSSFDPSKISPSLQEVQTAPPCSKYTDQPMPARETLVIRIKGPGALVRAIASSNCLT